MTRKYIEDQEIKNIDFTEKSFEIGTYEGCRFVDCNFSSLDIVNIHFEDCEFTNCNLSNTNLCDSSLQNIQFYECKLLGVKFEECNPFLFQVSFHFCHLDYASFYKMKVKNSFFENCNLEGVDFTEADLEKTVFSQCNLRNAIFERSNLTKTDFSTATNFSIDPTKNKMNKAIFDKTDLSGLLDVFGLMLK